jgi:tetratricopeptide (TPR) repeat protein
MKIKSILLILIIAQMAVLPALAADAGDQMNSAGALYSQSVDLANEGKYQQALDAADKALALNVTSLTPLIQSNRAGILVMLNRNTEAIAAADAALAVEGDLKTVHSIAYFNKGNALRALGRTVEAKDAYDHAYALDNTLIPPKLGADTPISSPSETTPLKITAVPATSVSSSTTPVATIKKSPLSFLPVFGALGIIVGLLCLRNKQ